MPADTERLEARVRRALDHGVAGYRGGDPAAARDHILGGVRRLRRRRLQLATGGFAVVLTLAVAVPLATRSGTTTPPRQGAAASSEAPAMRQPATSTTRATCTVGGGRPAPCGMVGPGAVFGTAASPTSASTNGGGVSTAVGSASTRPLVLRVGHEVVVALPGASSDASAGASWHPVRPVVDPLAHGRPVVTIRTTARRGVWRVLGQHAGTATVQAQRAGCSSRTPTCPAATSAWTLYVEVTS